MGHGNLRFIGNAVMVESAGKAINQYSALLIHLRDRDEAMRTSCLFMSQFTLRPNSSGANACVKPPYTSYIHDHNKSHIMPLPSPRALHELYHHR